MLRTLFVLVLASVGVRWALKGPFYGLLLYLWIAYFRPEEWVWHPFIRSLNLSLIAGVVVVASVLISRERLRFNMGIAAALLFFVQSTISLVYSPYPEYTLPFWMDFAKCTVITYLIAMLAADRSRYRIVLIVIALSLGFEAAKQGWVQLLINPGGRNDNEIAFLGDNNLSAVGVFMLVPILAALGRTASTPWEKRLFYFLMGGTIYRGLITYSRGGFLACGALLAAQIARSKRPVQSLVGAALIGIMIMPALPDSFWDRMNTITAKEDERDESVNGRFHFWQVAALMADSRPFVGVGHNSFNRSYNDYDFSYGQFGRSRNVHSSWFAVLAELGYPGVLLMVANLALAVLACWRARRLAARDPAYADVGQFGVALESSLLVFAVGGTFVTFQYTEMLWHMFGLSAALQLIVSDAALKVPAAAAEAERPAETAVVGRICQS
jgi:probable O-glycosylation ligase (exosortase A-associated)